ncbi:Mov34/MPN/PAD-1 family protein [Mucilaginibacter aquatilis]|uniref:MPN domain-containing protein n=1 Tax=Mucilaginibacter aquatilis TaxID=1517760 RepID=A0A6I4IAI7_9SPHI|nr:Mov34/MPN/PAD-1 family protein [Mucilaginibacter aquatilis]MVN90526.1 hypothetical protein [Mucilaginibacter aquatilis]
MRYKIWIKRTVIDFVYENGNRWLPKETGGVILGYRANSLSMVITDVIGPGSKAVHGHYNFHPDQVFHKKEIARKYEESGQRITYLGDWHTHPNSYPYLSNQDKATVRKIAAYKEARLPNPIMLIAAPPKKEFKAWVYGVCRPNKSAIYYKAEVIFY